MFGFARSSGAEKRRGRQQGKFSLFSVAGVSINSVRRPLNTEMVLLTSKKGRLHSTCSYSTAYVNM